MHENGTDHAEDKRKSYFKCEVWWFVLTGRGGYWWKKFCKKWRCPECCEAKIRNLQAQVCKAVPGPHVFVTEVNKTGRSLTQWIQRHIPKKTYYRAVKKPGGALLITRYAMPDSKRKSKSEFLIGEFADLIRNFSGKGNRITKRHADRKNQNKQNKEEQYGVYIKDDADDFRTQDERKRISEEYNGLQNDIERGRWLKENQEHIMLKPEGERLIADYEKHVEKEKAGH